ncbi:MULTISPECIES: hypothetical protein [Aequorivita]|uniref:Uncharacterized protein n=2 Tax=Aequorivita TaxID=153265 RepID=A0AB35YUI2_9FLAO|nr:hypothetical protein [Aequorivita sp. Ant34-E75]MCZ4319968.1 hypothetical protein [Aequorivita viscosa]WGF92141.1 hypothetical protein QCQ61_13130 [Aequorivita sp. Ant34-E75]
MATEEQKAMQVENFLNRAYKLDRRIKRPSKGEYYSLTRAEQDGNAQKELDILKNRIEQAIDIFFKQRLNHKTEEHLRILLSHNASAKNSNDINNVVEKGLLLTEPFK